MNKLKNLSVVWVVLAILVVFLAWGTIYQLEQTVHATGQIVPGTRTQIIQAADGGVLEKILVHEGESVKAGQVLAVLEKERANAGVEEGMAKVASLNAALIRARAEASGRAPDFKEIPPQYVEFVREQNALYSQRMQGLNEELGSSKQNLDLAVEELRINQKLMETGDISALELMRAKRQVAEISGRVSSIKNKFLIEARQEAAKLQDEISTQKFKLDERKSVLEHTELTSPVDGVVKSLRMNTLGGVLRAGDEMMQISPTEVELLLEVKVSPSEIGLLQLGLPTSVKVDAYDYTIYGSLTGRLQYLSSDTLSEQGANGQVISSFNARVSFEKLQANQKIELKNLKPGMTASVDIKTGSRSVLSYIFKPVSKAFQGAANQR